MVNVNGHTMVQVHIPFGTRVRTNITLSQKVPKRYHGTRTMVPNIKKMVPIGTMVFEYHGTMVLYVHMYHGTMVRTIGTYPRVLYVRGRPRH
jgi:hypothetical protein